MKLILIIAVISSGLIYERSTHYACNQVSDDPTEINGWLITMNGCVEGESGFDRRVKKLKETIEDLVK